MIKQFKIKSFDDLIYFIENEEASPKDIEEIVRQTMGVLILFVDNYDKSYLIKDLRAYWKGHYPLKCVSYNNEGLAFN